MTNGATQQLSLSQFYSRSCVQWPKLDTRRSHTGKKRWQNIFDVRLYTFFQELLKFYIEQLLWYGDMVVLHKKIRRGD